MNQALPDYGNWQKYMNPNPLQRYLIHRFLNVIAEMVSKAKPGIVLDVGCAEGFVIKHLQDTDENVKFLGIDIEVAVLKRGTDMGLSAPLLVMDAHSLAFADSSFDMVMALEVLEHLPDPDQALMEIKRVSKRYALLSVPYEPVFRTLNFLRGKHIRRLGNDPEHIHCWTEWSFKALVKQYFHLIEVRRALPWLVVLAEK